MQLALAHKPGGGDDDDDDDENDDIDLWGALYYIAARLNYETAAWTMLTSAGATLAQGGSMLDVIPPSFRALYELVIMADLARGALVYEYTDPKKYKKRKHQELPEDLKEINKLYFETQNRNGRKVGDPKIKAEFR